MTAQQVVHPGDVALSLARGGWHVLPVRREGKEPTGLTPRGHLDATQRPGVIARWWRIAPRAGVAVRAPEGVLGVDVDLHHPEGHDTYARLTQECGPLPATWITTSRTDGSGIRLYRVPAGIRWSDPGHGVDLIHHGHRYAVCAPSIHPQGRPYRWVGPDGAEHLYGPRVVDLAELPASWGRRLMARPVPAQASSTCRGAAGVSASGSEVRRGYGPASLAAGVRAVAEATHGRMVALNRQGYSLGGLVGAGVLSADDVARELYAAAVECGLVADDGQARVSRAIDAAIRAGMARPRQVRGAVR